MKLNMETAEIYVPGGTNETEATAKTTHMGISTHQDDLEIMAYHGILECFGSRDKHFMGVVVTNGSGSPRDDLYADYSDEDMMKVRRLEQKKAAHIGEYCALGLLDYPSAAVKTGDRKPLIEDIRALVSAARPDVIYTHNPADKHDTHVAVALRVIEALRGLPDGIRPKKLYGCEVWRGLDWVNDEDKVVFDVQGHENLAASLLGVFDSQICGGKRYDLASIGRRRANATYFASHGVDESTSIIFGIDLAPLLQNKSIDAAEYMRGYINRFAEDVSDRIRKFG